MKRVKLIEGKAFKIEPGKKYLIIFDKYQISKEDVSRIVDTVGVEYGAKALGIVIGNPEGVKVVEVLPS